jgi:transcriptional regulator with XRE-family HTH domain
MTVGDAIKALRHAWGWHLDEQISQHLVSKQLSQERFAWHMGVTLRTVVRWENGNVHTPRVLVHFRNLALSLKRQDLADVFEQRLREDLGWRMMPE